MIEPFTVKIPEADLDELHQPPDQLAHDIRRFFRPLRTATGLDTNRAASKEN